MAYFSNSTEGLDYQEQYCNKCLHNMVDESCPVWEAHLIYNYQECNNPDSILHFLIPRSKDKLSNEQCRMFYLIEV